MIDLVPDDEQREIAEAAAGAIAPLAGKTMTEVSEPEWRALADMGLFGLGLAEAAGGVGCGVAGEVLVGEVVGARLAPVSLAGPILAAHLLADSGAHAEADSIVHGRRRVALAAAPDGGGRWRVLDLAGAELVLVLAADRLLLVEGGHLVDVVELDSVDRGVGLASCEAAGASMASSDDPVLHSRGRLLLASMAVGVAGTALDRAVEYAGARHQFGRPIGAFQAVKHRCVDMAVRREAALSMVRFAAVRADAGIVDDAVEVAVAMSSEAARANAADAIQVFGGIGFTEEGGLQRVLHRAWLLDRLMGPVAQSYDRLVDSALPART